MRNIGVWEPAAEPGVMRNIKQAGERLMMMEVRFEAGAEGYRHRHPHEQMTYCLSGRFEFYVDGTTYPLEAGDTLCVPGGAEHGVKALEAGALLDVFTPLREDLLKRS